MPLDLKTFGTRTLSAIVFGLVMLMGLLWNTWSFITLFLLINTIALSEFLRLIERMSGFDYSKNEKMNFYLAGVSAYFMIVSSPMSSCNEPVNILLSRFFFYFMGLFIGALIILLMNANRKKLYNLLPGIGYISFSLGLIVQLRYMSLLLPVILILMIWMNDTMAYITGSILGKRKLMPSVSPKKTIEGTLGGILFTLGLAIVWASSTSWFPISLWIMIALIASVIGTIGDLAESKLKRMANVKDSGSIMPGHGGVLDRFDSLLLAAPFAFITSLILRICFEYKFV